MRIIFKITFILFSAAIFFIIFEMTSISLKYINKPLVTFDINNIRSKPVKVLIRKLDLLYSEFLIKFISEHKNYYIQNFSDYSSLPEFKLIKKKEENFSENLYPFNNVEKWERSHGNYSSIRFSSLKKINKSNVNQLDVAWIYDINDKIFSDLQANPIVACL